MFSIFVVNMCVLLSCHVLLLTDSPVFYRSIDVTDYISLLVIAWKVTI